MYQRGGDETTIIYFNGLGLPLNLTSEKIDSSFHWFHRAWTLQETTKYWLPGGLTMPIPGGSSGGFHFMDLMRQSMEAIEPRNRTFMELVRTFQGRSGVAEKKAIDRIAALSYLIPGHHRKIYSLGESVADAWNALVFQLLDRENLAVHLVDILTRCPIGGVDHWIPSYDLLSSSTERVPRLTHSIYTDEQPLTGSLAGPMFFTNELVYHFAFVLDSRCEINQRNDSRTVEIYVPANMRWSPVRDSRRPFSLEVFADIPPNEEFILVGLAGLECWIVGKNMGEMIIDDVGEDEPTVLIKKLTIGRMRSRKGRDELRKLSVGRIRPVAYWDKYQGSNE